MFDAGIERGQSELDRLAQEAMDGANQSAKSDAPLSEESPPNSASAWPEPQEIPCSLLPVEPFSPELLPVALRHWVSDIANRMQCPPDFPAVGAMVALSSVIGRKACIQPKRQDDWQVVPNLWGAIVGRPGVMKALRDRQGARLGHR